MIGLLAHFLILNCLLSCCLFTILCYVLLFTVISLYLLSLLMISIFSYRFYECNNCTLCYMYLQAIRINIIILLSLFAPGLWSAIWVSFFHSRSVVRVTFQSLVMSVFWVKNESVWSVMTTCNGI